MAPCVWSLLGIVPMTSCGVQAVEKYYLCILLNPYLLWRSPLWQEGLRPSRITYSGLDKEQCPLRESQDESHDDIHEEIFINVSKKTMSLFYSIS